jgi:hypothetical protein
VNYAAAFGARENVADHRLIFDDEFRFARRAMNGKQFHEFNSRCALPVRQTSFQYSVPRKAAGTFRSDYSAFFGSSSSGSLSWRLRAASRVEMKIASCPSCGWMS